QEGDETLNPLLQIAEGAQQMDLGFLPLCYAQSETDSTDYSTNDDDDVAETSIFKFTWAIKNFSRLKTRKLYSDVFLVGGHQWFVDFSFQC
ncbi:hypothetical protein BHE74_00044343, partial [Ensete ventricosum]